MDIYLDEREKDDYVVIYEIKATDWDNIKTKNIRRNLYRHGRQLHKYIDQYIKTNTCNVIFGVLYPKPPKKEGLKELVEKIAMDKYDFPVYWYSELIE